MILVVTLGLVLALGAWLAHRGANYLVAVGAFIALLAIGSAIFVATAQPNERLGRVGGSILAVLPVAAAAAVAFSGRLWKRPWLVVVLAALAYSLGLILSVSLWMWLGLPH